MTDEPYNPLDKLNLGRSIQAAALTRDPIPLTEVGAIKGAGVYVLYYAGKFGAYGSIAGIEQPIYVGKAIPKGGRKGGLTKDASKGKPMADRLGQHANSIKEATNLDLSDFYVRYLMLDDVWIPLGENILIESFKPIWNRAIDGFGNKDPGRRRSKQYKSPWDILHPGRIFTQKLADSGLTYEFLIQRVADYFAGKELQKLPKAIEEQQAEEEAEAEEAANDA